jgi:maltooligosyltrehalose trehalohydrolase
MRRFVDAAHAAGLAVILDVVYNHLGPDGALFDRFSPHYFTDRHDNDWGQALNFDDADSGPVREFFITNAVHWISEFHLDGLRIDAAQAIVDSSPEHILAAVAAGARAAAPGRRLLLVAENEPQDPVMLHDPNRGGHGLDAAVSDDFHHSASVAATGRQEAYLTDYRGSPQELLSCVKRGYLYQGQYYSWQANPRGSFSLDLGSRRFVHYLQTHDQVANTFRGRRSRAWPPPTPWPRSNVAGSTMAKQRRTPRSSSSTATCSTSAVSTPSSPSRTWLSTAPCSAPRRSSFASSPRRDTTGCCSSTSVPT